ncbi:MAG: SlyX family protein [Hydrogenophaga sp.]|nr:SlyX family protein [Hydrogenophaga sp.]
MSHPHTEPLTAQRNEERLTQLEIKLSFTEDWVETLNQLVIEQQAQIDSLKRQLQAMRLESPSDGANAARNPRDELPPHY